MKIFVTGGSGYLGQALLTRLKNEGHHTLALVRSDAAALSVQALGAESVRGDFSQINDWESQLGGCDVVIHAAAPVLIWGPWDVYQQAIVDASIDIFQACERQQVQRFVYISSESVMQDRMSLIDIDETLSLPKQPNSNYGRAKLLAEQGILKKLASVTTRIIIRPTFIWGPQNKSLAEVADKVKQGMFVWASGGKSYFEAVHRENVVESIDAALTKGSDRDVFLVTDDAPSDVREFFTAVFDALSLPQPKMSIPAGLLSACASAIEWLWRRLNLKKRPPLTRFEVAFIAQPRRYNIARTRQVLGYHPVISRAEGLLNLKEHGLR